MAMTDGTGKPCPKCGTPMVNLSSINERQCIGCGHSEPWKLAEGQKSILGKGKGEKQQ
jgi:ssDNA-binding Zn-finger/Zn-ribbon topoisomerase 1